MLFAVKSPADFTAVERHVAALLSSDESRCSFLRSEPFARIRMHAVYRPQDPCVPSPCWGPEGLCVEMRNKLVSVEIREPKSQQYDDSWCGPVVYDVVSGYEGPFDAIYKARSHMETGKRHRADCERTVEDMV